MIYLSIDVGLTHLALVRAHVQDFQLQSILELRLVNLNALPHDKVTRSQCTLHHSNDVFDKIEHFLQEHGDLFHDVDCVLIERQPLGGLVHVEQLLFGRFRRVARLVSPNALHKWMGIHHLEYEQRKEATTRYAQPYLGAFPAWQHSPRLHDMADALCILLYSLQQEAQHDRTRQEEERLRQQQEHYAASGINLQEFFDRFRYRPPPSS